MRRNRTRLLNTVSLIFMAIVMLMFSACGLIKLSKETPKDEEEQQSSSRSEKSRLLSSLIAYDPMQHFLSPKMGEQIEYHKLKIEKRLTDKKARSDQVWVNFIAETTDDLAEVYARMDFTLYNDGWLLDNVEILERKGTPLTGPEPFLADSIMSEKYDYYELCDEEFHSEDLSWGVIWIATKHYHAYKAFDYLEECYDVTLHYHYIDTGRQGVGAPYWDESELSETLVNQNWGKLLGYYQGRLNCNDISWQRYYDYTLNVTELLDLGDGRIRAIGEYAIDEYDYYYQNPRLEQSTSSDFDIISERKYGERARAGEVYYYFFLKDAGARLYLSPTVGLGLDFGNYELQGPISDSISVSYDYDRFAESFFNTPPSSKWENNISPLTSPYPTDEEHNSEALDLITDNAELLSDDQLADLNSRAVQLTNKYSIDVRIITVDSLDGDNVEDYTESVFDQYDLGFGPLRNCILLLISTEFRDFDLMAHGYGNYAFTDYGRSELIDRFLPYLRNNDWYGGFSAYLDGCAEFLRLADQGNPIDS